jgi:hypothetical protein
MPEADLFRQLAPGKISPIGDFGNTDLPPAFCLAYFTVTVNQNSIDLWSEFPSRESFHPFAWRGKRAERQGGRTTFSARGTKTTDPYKLVPAINIVDGMTGLPPSINPTPESPSKPDASSCRLPVLVFCGIDDDGLGIDDEEFLGKPLWVMVWNVALY